MHECSLSAPQQSPGAYLKPPGAQTQAKATLRLNRGIRLATHSGCTSSCRVNV